MLQKTLAQWEIYFNKVAKLLGRDLKDIDMQLIMLANGKTFKGMMHRLDKKLLEIEHKSYMRINNGTEYAQRELFLKLCSEVFEVPEYHIDMLLKEDEQRRLGDGK